MAEFLDEVAYWRIWLACGCATDIELAIGKAPPSPGKQHACSEHGVQLVVKDR